MNSTYDLNEVEPESNNYDSQKIREICHHGIACSITFIALACIATRPVGTWIMDMDNN